MSNANTREFTSAPRTWHKGHKYYNIHIQHNLFGGASLIKTWGAKGSKRGGHQIVYCDSEGEAVLAITAAVKRRRKEIYLDKYGMGRFVPGCFRFNRYVIYTLALVNEYRCALV